jgi:hypothetical protein
VRILGVATFFLPVFLLACLAAFGDVSFAGDALTGVFAADPFLDGFSASLSLEFRRDGLDGTSFVLLGDFERGGARFFGDFSLLAGEGLVGFFPFFELSPVKVSEFSFAFGENFKTGSTVLDRLAVVFFA